MSKQVYYSDIWSNFNVFAMVNTGVDPYESMEVFKNNRALSDQILDRANRYEKANKLSLDELPLQFFVDRGKSVKELPQAIFANGYIVVQQKCADVFSQFDLGQTDLVPCKILQADRKTELDGTYYVVNFGTQKNVLLPEKSLGLRPPYEHPDEARRVLPDGRGNDQIAVSAAALEGPDMWYDPKMLRTTFMSGALHDALKDAKLDKLFKFYSCRVIGLR
jgi:hypothetical protein